MAQNLRVVILNELAAQKEMIAVTIEDQLNKRLFAGVKFHTELAATFNSAGLLPTENNKEQLSAQRTVPRC